MRQERVDLSTLLVAPCHLRAHVALELRDALPELLANLGVRGRLTDCSAGESARDRADEYRQARAQPCRHGRVA